MGAEGSKQAKPRRQLDKTATMKFQTIRDRFGTILQVQNALRDVSISSRTVPLLAMLPLLTPSLLPHAVWPRVLAARGRSRFHQVESVAGRKVVRRPVSAHNWDLAQSLRGRALVHCRHPRAL